MVLYISRPARAEFYIRSQNELGASSDYGHARGERPGTWWNPSALLLDEDGGPEHANTVDPAHFYKLFRGLHPRTAKKLARNADSEKRCPGYDLTFCADKSISILWAIATPELENQIRFVHRQAVHTALDDVVVAYCAFARRRPDRDFQQVLRARVLAALFQHGASRAGEPHLHTRAFVFNLSHIEGDSKWRSLHGRSLYIWQKAAGAVYRAELAWLLSHKLGIRIERYGVRGEFTRIPDLPPSLIARWSSRKFQLHEISDRLSSTEPLSPEAKETLRRRTTNTSAVHLSADIRHVDWRLDALEYVPNISALMRSLVQPDHRPSTDASRDLQMISDIREDLVEIVKTTARPLTHQALLAGTASASAGLLSRQHRNHLFETVRRHPDIAPLLQPLPFHHGKKIYSVQKAAK